MSTRARPKAATVASLTAAAYVFTTVMLGTTLPTPLYPQYQSEFGFRGTVTTELFAIYAGGVILGLILFGRLSEMLGRRPVLLAGVILSIASAVLFCIGTQEWLLFVGRVLSGFAAGLLTSTGTVSVMENAPVGRERLGGAVATAANIGGLGLGIVLAGVASQVALVAFPDGWSLRAPYVLHMVMLVLAGLALLPMRDPIERRRGAFRLQMPGVPADTRHVFGPASLGAVVGFATMGIYSSVVPNVLSQMLSVTAPAALGLIIGAVFLASAAAQVALKSLSDRWLILCGSLSLACGMLLGILTLRFESLPMLVLAAILNGAGQGLLFMTGLRVVTAATASEHRTEVTTSYFVVAYLSISIPSVAAGLLIPVLGLAATGLLSFSVLGLAALAGLFNLRRFSSS
ncbi:MFS transporter [Rothia koreensis]|jgi:MFS family permease|uniref:MFS transporter n=1 Tax=Rothia koreensis TaxID=592378 RepID=UPI0037C7EE10